MSEPNDAAEVRVFPPAIPLVTVLLGTALNYLIPLGARFTPVTHARYWVGALLVVGSILGLGWRSVRLVRGSGQSENPWKPTFEILDRGPFRMTRNPMYLQMLLVCVGVAMILWNAWILVLTPLCAWVLYRFAILPEEAYLERKFGDIYLAYKHRVRRWL